MRIVALPGFLGTPQDLKTFSDFSMSVSTKSFASSWDTWAQLAALTLQTNKGSEKLIGLGYSLGGRLLLSLVDQNPDLFDGLIFLSTHPGLQTDAEKAERMKNDEAWAKRFETENWEVLMRDWNAQKVFQGGQEEPARLEESYSRKQLAHLLRAFSLAKQPDYRPMISEISVPQLWIAGEKDEKFVGLLPKASKKIKTMIVPEASHRVYFDQPELIKTAVGEFALSVELGSTAQPSVE